MADMNRWKIFFVDYWFYPKNLSDAADAAEGGGLETACLSGITQLFLCSMTSQMMVRGMWQTGRGSSAYLSPAGDWAGWLTAYLGGHVFPKLASQFFQVGVLFSVSFFLARYAYFKICLVTHLRYKPGNTSYPLVFRLSLDIGNNETAENKRQKAWGG